MSSVSLCRPFGAFESTSCQPSKEESDRGGSNSFECYSDG